MSSTYNPVLLAYDTYEPVEGADYNLSPVIFLHGVTASRKYWEDIPQRVADETRRKIYVLDARNHGDSDWSDDFSFELVTKDLDSFMERHSIRRAIHVGHSMGGMAGIKLALTKPERVEKLIVEDMMVRKLPKPLGEMVAGIICLMQKSLDAIPEGANEDDARKAIADFIASHLPPTDIPMLKQNAETRGKFIALKKGSDDRYTFKGNMNSMLKAVQEYSEVFKEAEGSFEGPALFIYGTVSPFNVGKEEENIKQHFPNAEFVGVEDATHLVHNDNPEEFTEAILKFITS